MSEGVNKVFLLGNIGAEPELKATSGGQMVLKLRIATTESYLDKNNARQERTEWHSVTVWGKRGEGLAKHLEKGSRIFVEGRISTSSYEKDGEKRYRTEIVANNILLTGGRGRGGDAGASRGGDDFGAPPEARGGGGGGRGNYGGGGGGGGNYGGGGGGGGGRPAPQQQQQPAAPQDDYNDFGADDDIPF